MRSRTGPLRLRAFRWFFAGRLASLTGSAMTPVALALAVLDAVRAHAGARSPLTPSTVVPGVAEHRPRITPP